MNYNNIPQRTNDLVRVSCAALFCLFSFVYLYMIQGDLLANAQYALSGGVTHYSQFFGAVMITFILWLVQFLTARFTGLNGRTYALTYFPSFLLLTFITSVNKAVFTDFTIGVWAWVLPVCVVVYAMVVFVVKNISEQMYVDYDNHASASLWPNYVVMLVMMLVTGGIHNTPDVELYEMKAETKILAEDYNDAYATGEEALETSQRLTMLRNFALAQDGQLGERLFDYPQPYGIGGLIDMDDTLTYEEFNVRHLTAQLGLCCDSTEWSSVEDYLARLFERDTMKTNRVIGDYVICANLLRRDMAGFLGKLRVYYPKDSVSTIDLPRAYREALIVEADSIGDDSLNSFADTLMLQNYRDYLDMRDGRTEIGDGRVDAGDETARANYLRRKFGKTLFWYFDGKE